MTDNASDSVQHVEVFTDGACEGNPGPGGYGVVLRFGHHRKEMAGAFKETTNNRMELMAAIVALQALKRRCRVTLTTDSKYLANPINKGWAKRWLENGWWRSENQRAANHDLWSLLLDLLAKHDVTFVWTRGHSGHAENECCDRLARLAVGAAGAEIDSGYEQAKTAGAMSIPEGHPCFKCRTPIVKRSPKPGKSSTARIYHWYLFCPGCSAMYMVDAGKRLPSSTSPSPLFDAPEEEV